MADRDDRFNEVFAYDVLEHCADLIAVMEELHRVCRDGAVVRITVPHFSSANAYIDPTHQLRLSYQSFDYVTGQTEVSFYTACRYRYRARQLIFARSLLNRLIGRPRIDGPGATKSVGRGAFRLGSSMSNWK